LPSPLEGGLNSRVAAFGNSPASFAVPVRGSYQLARMVLPAIASSFNSMGRPEAL
jgi:hypothetical protein